MDKHFYDTPLEDNLPVLMAVIGISTVRDFPPDSIVLTPPPIRSVRPQISRLLPTSTQQPLASWLRVTPPPSRSFRVTQSDGKSVTNAGHRDNYQTGVSLLSLPTSTDQLIRPLAHSPKSEVLQALHDRMYPDSSAQIAPG